MTRIIQRCFLILAFAGILLSAAQQTTLSDVPPPHSTSQPGVGASSGSESSTASAGQPTSSAPSPDSDVTSDGAGTSSKTEVDGVSEHVDGATGEESENVQSTNDRESGPTPSISHSDGLYKTGVHDAESSSVTGKSPEKLSGSSDKAVVADSGNVVLADKGRHTPDITTAQADAETSNAESETTEVSVSEFARDEAATKPVAALQPTDASSRPGQSSVPSTEEPVNGSGDSDRNRSPEVSSTLPSEVQTDEDDSAKSGTQKRSLNATSTMASSTPVMHSGYVSSSATPVVALSKDIAPPPPLETTEHVDDSAEILTTTKEPADASLKVEKKVLISKSVTTTTASEVTRSPHAIDSATMKNPESSDAHDSDRVAELASRQDDPVSPISSAALSTLSEDSIHPFETIQTTAQISNETSGVSHSSPRKAPELELESAVPTGHSYPPVTFDPDGMTHNLPQDPDAVTFSNGIFHVDGNPKDGTLLSRLEQEESSGQQQQSEFVHAKSAEGTTIPPGLPGNGSRDPHPSEREREPVSPSGQALLPHDEPDFEKMFGKTAAPGTKSPEVVTPPPADGSLLDFHSKPDSGKVASPANDESEEMLNDSPHFVQVQSKPATTPAAKSKDELTRNPGMNVGNDITPTADSTPLNTEAAHELDFSAEYRSEQSEIRPVTAASPFKISESATVQPVPVESGRPDTVPPDTSSPIILSNPAPADTHKTAETTTTIVVLHPEVVAQNNASTGYENDTAVNTSSTIAGVAVKTSVSVSLPLSNIPNDTTISHAIQVVGDANFSSNASEVILALPIPVNKDADGHPAPTEAPAPLTTESSGLRIRKPKLKINSEDDGEPATPRTRKPFISPYQRASTTAGPPVSIFKKARTRMASITSSTTARPFRQFSTIRIHYASRIPGMVPGGELVFSTEPVTTIVPTTTETEEPFSDEPFTDLTMGPIVPSEDDVTLLKVAGYIALEKGLRWNDQLISRFTPQYKEKANFLQIQLDRLFRTSPIASQLWKIQIDGFSVIKNTKSVAVDFMLYLIKTPNAISMQQMIFVFHDKLKNNTFSRFTVDTNRTSFELLSSEPMRPTTEPPEEEPEPVIPQWAIAVIVVGAASLIFIVLFAAVAILGRHHMRRRYSSKLNDEDSDRPSDWESKMAAAYENLAADTIYDAEDLHSETYKKRYQSSTFHGRPSGPRRADSWSSSDWSPPPRRPRPQVHRIVVD